MIWLKRSVKTLLVLFILVSIVVYVSLKSSQPKLEGEIISSISTPSIVERDENGLVTISAANRASVAYSLGFIHAQERFFQMDLLRKNSAGELSELFGKVAVNFDKRIRVHQFRAKAHQYIKDLPPQHIKILEQYTHGVNAGLENLTIKPFEYLLLNKHPNDWLPEDSMLVLYSMYIDLQYQFGEREELLGILKENLMTDVYQFLTPAGSTWDAAIDGTTFHSAPIPKNSFEPAPIIDDLKLLTHPSHFLEEKHEALAGSNSWVVDGQRSQTGSALLANDMHLGIRVPNIWFRAGFRYQNGTQNIKIDGVTLPGTPAMVVGSNQKVAWGFTNSYGDWSELISLKLNADRTQYLTPDGYKPFTYDAEVIRIKGTAPVSIEIKKTIWGPVISRNTARQEFVLRWSAHDPEGVNFNLLNLEAATSTEQAIDVAHTMAIPAQNIVIADQAGDIAWTIAGPMPIKVSTANKPDWQTPQDWSQGEYKWTGYMNPNDKPTVYNPESGRIWTANSRVIGGAMYKKVGNGGYALGARALQIKKGLFNLNSFNEQDFLDIQNDHQADFLLRWQQLMLEQVLTNEFVDNNDLADLKFHVENWQYAASVDSVGYSIVSEFRIQMRKILFEPLLSVNKLDTNKPMSLHPIRHQLETPMWAMLTEQPSHLLPPTADSWDKLMQSTLLSTKSKLESEFGSLDNARWGNVNKTNVQHPLSKAIPALSWLLDMPQAEAPGDSYMPRVQGKSFGSSERFVVSPGHESSAILHMPSGQSGHPLSPYFGRGHQAWVDGTPQPLLPSKTKYKLQLIPKSKDLNFDTQ